MDTITKQISKIPLFNQSEVSRIMGLDRSTIRKGKNNKTSIKAITPHIEEIRKQIVFFITSGSFKSLQTLGKMNLIKFNAIKSFLEGNDVLITMSSSQNRVVEKSVKTRLIDALFQRILDLKMDLDEEKEVLVSALVETLPYGQHKCSVVDYFNDFVHNTLSFETTMKGSRQSYTLSRIETETAFIDGMLGFVYLFKAKYPEYLVGIKLGYIPAIKITFPDGNEIFLSEKTSGSNEEDNEPLRIGKMEISKEKEGEFLGDLKELTDLSEGILEKLKEGSEKTVWEDDFESSPDGEYIIEFNSGIDRLNGKFGKILVSFSYDNILFYESNKHDSKSSYLKKHYPAIKSITKI